MINLKTKEDAAECMERLMAWLHQDIIDRVPVQFHRHDMSVQIDREQSRWSSLKERWFDAEYQASRYRDSITDRTFLAESFPVYWPNLGPDVLAAFYGINLEYAEETSYAIHSDKSIEELDKLLTFSRENPYFTKLEELTSVGLEMAADLFYVGYSDFHPGMDTVAAWRNPEQMCMDLLLDPAGIRKLLDKSVDHFQWVFDHFYDKLKAAGQPCVNWLGVPTKKKLHIPSCDFAAMISTEAFEEFNLPLLREELKPMDHNIFHLDGPGMIRHLDLILELPEIDGIQWVQGEGDDKAIEQWKPLVRKIQAKGKSVVVMVQPDELGSFISDMDPKGILLSIPSTGIEEEKAMLSSIIKWTKAGK